MRGTLGWLWIILVSLVCYLACVGREQRSGAGRLTLWARVLAVDRRHRDYTFACDPMSGSG